MAKFHCSARHNNHQIIFYVNAENVTDAYNEAIEIAKSTFSRSFNISNNLEIEMDVSAWN
jgi:hypothetical protein